MIEQTNSPGAPLNSYNVAQLQFSLADPKCDSNPFVDDSPTTSPAVIKPDSDIEFTGRRMSSSATSTTDTDSSAVSRSEKQSVTPSDSPQAKSAHTSGEHQNTWHAKSNSATSNGEHHSKEAGVENTKVQLPSIYTTFEDSFRGDLRRASLPNLHSDNSISRIRHAPYPPTGGRAIYAPINPASLSSYQFPPSESSSYNESTFTNNTVAHPTPSSSTFPSSTSSTFSSPLSSDYRSAGLSPNSFPEHENWGASSVNIARPNSTPGQSSGTQVKYDEGIRHSSFSSSLSQSPMFAGSTRISGQDRSRSFCSGVKSDWSFPNSEFVLPSSTPTYTTSPSVTSPVPSVPVVSSPRSPQSANTSQLVDRPQRKRGKLPKETTDFLKSWLHRHSDHPYPSEEEKKQLCHATGLSMSQVSNWMINARRRILAPAHRAASGPTTTAPFPPARTSALLDPTNRRSSMPSDGLQLYHPMTLQSLPNGGPHSAGYVGSTRQLLGLPPVRTSYGTSGSDLAQPRLNMSYLTPSQGPHSAGATPVGSFLPSNVPLSAPPTLPPNPFAQHHHGHAAYSSHSSQNYGPNRLQNEVGRGAEPPSSTFYSESHSQPATAAQSVGYQTSQ